MHRRSSHPPRLVPAMCSLRLLALLLLQGARAEEEGKAENMLVSEEQEKEHRQVTSLESKLGLGKQDDFLEVGGLERVVELVVEPVEAYISSLASLEAGASQAASQFLKTETSAWRNCGVACGAGVLGTGVLLYNLLGSEEEPTGVNRRGPSSQRRVSIAENLFNRVVGGIQRMQEVSAQRQQELAETNEQRRKAFWSYVNSAAERNEETRLRNKNSLANALKNRRDSLAGWFKTVQERSDTQRRAGLAALSSMVQGLVSGAGGVFSRLRRKSVEKLQSRYSGVGQRRVDPLHLNPWAYLETVRDFWFGSSEQRISREDSNVQEDDEFQGEEFYL